MEVEYGIQNSRLKIKDWKLVYLAPSSQLKEEMLNFPEVRLSCFFRENILTVLVNTGMMIIEVEVKLYIYWQLFP